MSVIWKQWKELHGIFRSFSLSEIVALTYATWERISACILPYFFFSSVTGPLMENKLIWLQGVLAIWLEFSVIPGRNQVERFIPVECFQKNGSTFRGIPLFSLLPVYWSTWRKILTGFSSQMESAPGHTNSLICYKLPAKSFSHKVSSMLPSRKFDLFGSYLQCRDQEIKRFVLFFLKWCSFLSTRQITLWFVAWKLIIVAWLDWNLVTWYLTSCSILLNSSITKLLRLLWMDSLNTQCSESDSFLSVGLL